MHTKNHIVGYVVMDTVPFSFPNLGLILQLEIGNSSQGRPIQTIHNYDPVHLHLFSLCYSVIGAVLQYEFQICNTSATSLSKNISYDQCDITCTLECTFHGPVIYS